VGTVYNPATAASANVAPSLSYASATALTWAWAGLCFSAVTAAGADPELVCAGVLDGDLSVVTRSSTVGVFLGAGATYFTAKGHNIFTGCSVAGAGGSHLCAYDGVRGELVWSTKDDPAGLSVQYNAFGLIGSTLYFAAEAAGSGTSTLWALGL